MYIYMCTLYNKINTELILCDLFAIIFKKFLNKSWKLQFILHYWKMYANTPYKTTNIFVVHPFKIEIVI